MYAKQVPVRDVLHKGASIIYGMGGTKNSKGGGRHVFCPGTSRGGHVFCTTTSRGGHEFCPGNNVI